MPFPPGPRGTEVIAVLNDWRRNGLAAFERLAQRYGDIAYASVFGKRIFLFSHPDAIQHALIDNSENYLKTKGNRNAQLYFGDSMQLNNGAKARDLRRAMTPSFHQSRVAHAYDGIVVETTQKSIAEWTTGSRASLTRDVMELALAVAVRIHFGASAKSTAENLAGLFRDALNRLNGFLPPAWIPALGNPQYQRAIDALNLEVFRRIGERRAAGPIGDDLLCCLITAGMSDEEIRHELVSMMAAGYQTIGIALNQTLRLVAQHPDVDKRLYSETLVGDFSFAEQVIKESLRCAPPAGAIARLVAADDQVRGWKIPANSRVFMSSWVMHRDARFYDDPLKFKPERWTPQFERTLPLCAYFPFGRGARGCIGGAMSMAMLKLMLATVVQRYRLTAEQTGEPRPFDHGDVPLAVENRAPATMRAG